MIKQEPLKLWFIAIILTAFMSTWAIVSNSQNEVPSSIVPTVTATSPTDGATAVTLNQPLSVTFSQAMSAPSMAACLILQRPDGTLVSGTVNTFGRTSIFRPLVNLAPKRTYTGRVRREASDLAGVPLGHSYVWSFTTGTTIDATAPTVSFTNPANLDVNGPTNQQIVAMFSKEMSAGTLTTTTFMVTKPGGIAVPGAVNYASGSVTLGPRSVSKVTLTI